MVNKYPVRKLVLPSDLVGVTAGKVPKELLRLVNPYGWLHHLAADAYHAMRSAAILDGIRPFKPTSAGDTYRSLEMQRVAFVGRYQKEPVAGAETRTWNGVKWYKKSPKLASLAAPGSSNHNLGLAVDIWGASGERLNWLLNNCARFGWSWELQSEPWHLRYVKGDKVPKAVLLWKEANG